MTKKERVISERMCVMTEWIHVERKQDLHEMFTRGKLLLILVEVI